MRIDMTGSCNVKECESQARWRLGLKVWARNKPEAERTESNAASLETGIVVCDHHMTYPSTPASDFFSAAGRQRVEQGFIQTGHALPDFDKAEYQFTPLAHAKPN